MAVRFQHLIALAFLTVACGAPARPPAAPATSPDNVPGPEAVLVAFHPRTSERWTLRRSDSSYVCTLPCSYWVGPEAELHVQLESATTFGEEGTTYDVPRPLPANPGEQLTVSIDRQHGLGTIGKVIAAPMAVMFGLFGVALTTLSTVSLATGSKDVTSTTGACTSVNNGTDPSTGAQVGAEACTERTDKGVAADVGALAIGVGMLGIATLATVWFFHDRAGGFRYEGASPTRAALRVRVTPGVVGLETSGTRTWLTPAGIHGTF